MKEGNSGKGKQLFRSYSFILLVNNLNQNQIEKIRKMAHDHGVRAITNLQCPTQKDDVKLKADYLLAEESIDASEIRVLLPPTVVYLQALNAQYIYNCIKANRILSTRVFRLKGEKVDDEQSNSEGRKKVKKDFVPLAEEKSKKQDKADITSSKDSLHNNKFIIEQLNKLYKVYANEGDKGRKIAYSRAIAALKGLTKDLETDDDVDAIKKQRHIGDKIAAKIKELLKTGHIRKLEQLKNTDKNLGLEELTRVWGIGSAKAKQLYDRGIKTIEELREQCHKNPDILTKNQKIGLHYLEDLQIRIPRKKVTAMFEVVRETLFQMVGNRDLHDIQVCGSYRREKPTCGDMDIFITRKDGTFEKDLLTQLVKKLSDKGFLTDHLTMPRHVSANSCQSYMGICQFKDELHHRVDIKYYPADQFAFAVLYFTGSDAFNRKMRLWAIEHGYHLSDHGLYKSDKIGAKSNPTGPPIKCKTEKDIFDVLGIEYKHPKDRDI